MDGWPSSDRRVGEPKFKGDFFQWQELCSTSSKYIIASTAYLRYIYWKYNIQYYITYGHNGANIIQNIMYMQYGGSEWLRGILQFMQCPSRKRFMDGWPSSDRRVGEPKFKGDFFQLCTKRKLADQDHSYKYSSSASRFEESSRTTIKKDLDKIELTLDFVNDTDVLMKEMCNLGWNFNGMRMNSRNYVEEEDDRFNSFIIFFFICIVSS